jgi:predicted component of type VI protein secretion system
MENHVRRLLIMTEGPNEGQVYVLEGMICTLGRTPDNTIVIDSPRISRHHAQIRLLPNKATLEDMGSTNGTFVNGRQISGPHPLTHGDKITLADFASFRYEIEDTMETERLAPVSPESAPTQAMSEMPNYPSIPKPPTPRPSREETPPAEAAAPPAPDWLQEEATPPEAKRPTWRYIVLGVLVLLILLCIALAIYLWFAPEEFWYRLFELVGVSTP